MNKTLVLMAAAALTFVGCERGDRTMDEAAGAAKERIEQEQQAQEEQIKAQKEQIEESAGAKKESIEAQADAEKAQLEAQQKQTEAQAEAQKAQLEAQEQQAQAQAEAQKAQQDAQAEAQQAQQEAQQESAQAQAEAQQKQADAQQQTQVDESAGAANTDKELETRVRTSLFGDQAATTATTDQTVQITVSGGKVTLKGTVKSDAEKQQWEQKAKSVSGVQSVDNQLTVQQ